MYNKNYYLYVTPINGEENSIDRQLQSGRAFRNSNMPCDYRQVVTEHKEEMDKPIAHRMGFNSFPFRFCDGSDRNILVIDIAVLNNTDYFGLWDLKSYFSFLDIVIISNGRYVSNLGLEYPSAVTRIISEETQNTNNKKRYRSFQNVAAYCCDTDKINEIGISQIELADYYASMVTSTKNLHIYKDVGENNASYAYECQNFTAMLKEVKKGNYNIVIVFADAFRINELDRVISEIRKYVPVILIDEDERFNFLDVIKEDE